MHFCCFSLQYFCAGAEGVPPCCWDQIKGFLSCIVNGVLVTLCDHTHLRCKKKNMPVLFSMSTFSTQSFFFSSVYPPNADSLELLHPFMTVLL